MSPGTSGPGRHAWTQCARWVFGRADPRVLARTGNPADTPTLHLPCREVCARGQQSTGVIGPVADVEAEIAALHQDFWRRSDGGVAHPGD